jgi:tRNA U34 5-methylaminomethyl-2-thiouridine-forming methyltransferase MnmC
MVVEIAIQLGADFSNRLFKARFHHGITPVLNPSNWCYWHLRSCATKTEFNPNNGWLTVDEMR